MKPATEHTYNLFPIFYDYIFSCPLLLLPFGRLQALYINKYLARFGEWLLHRFGGSTTTKPNCPRIVPPYRSSCTHCTHCTHCTLHIAHIVAIFEGLQLRHGGASFSLS